MAALIYGPRSIIPMDDTCTLMAGKVPTILFIINRVLIMLIPSHTNKIT